MSVLFIMYRVGASKEPWGALLVNSQGEDCLQLLTLFVLLDFDHIGKIQPTELQPATASDWIPVEFRKQ